MEAMQALERAAECCRNDDFDAFLRLLSDMEDHGRYEIRLARMPTY